MNNFRRYVIAALALTLAGASALDAQAQEKIKIAYSSTDTLNQIWTIAQDAGFYKKNGLDVDLVYIGSTTVGIAAIMAQDIQVGNAAGSGVANANVRGADTVSVACTINVLAYELVVLDSIKTAEDLMERVGRAVGDFDLFLGLRGVRRDGEEKKQNPTGNTSASVAFVVHKPSIMKS